MKDLQTTIRNGIYQKAEDIGLQTLTIRDTERLSITTIDRTLALTLQLQKLLIRLGATIPKQGVQK